ncbi:MAG TPA: ribosome maturation factor RimP [Acidimicrobiales bacterium]|nr:ribosome maturation factor RimP [Acidimicrobiales bacterium]
MEWDTTLRPMLSSLGLELYDVEFSAGTLNVVVNRPGGVDLESLTKANRTISEWLDANDPIAGRFTLDVSSPGLERRLRTPAHFASAVGELVTLRERRDGEPTRRLEGTLSAVDDTTLTIDDNDLGAVTIALDAIERARTVFAWGATKPATSKGAKTSSTSKKG